MTPGRVIGGANVITDEHPVMIDIEVERHHQRQGHGSRPFAAVEAAAYDIETGSNQSLAEGTLSPMGYAFHVVRTGRRELSPPPLVG